MLSLLIWAHLLLKIRPFMFSLLAQWWELNGSWWTELMGCQTGVFLHRAGLLLRALVFHRGSFRVNGGETFYDSDSDVCLPGDQFSFLAPGPKPAGEWYIHRHTCWVRVGGLFTDWGGKNDQMNQSCLSKWISRGSAVHCASHLKTPRTHCDLFKNPKSATSRTSLVHRHNQNLGWTCCDFPSWNRIDIHDSKYWTHHEYVLLGKKEKSHICAVKKTKLYTSFKQSRVQKLHFMKNSACQVNFAVRENCSLKRKEISEFDVILHLYSIYYYPSTLFCHVSTHCSTTHWWLELTCSATVRILIYPTICQRAASSNIGLLELDLFEWQTQTPKKEDK